MTTSLQDPHLQPGAIVGEYRLLHILGSGGMGSVWLVEHVMLGKKFALKVLLHEYASDPETRARFEREARAVGKLDHPNVVSAVNYGYTQDGRPFLVLEALTGKSLRDLLNQALAESREPLTAPHAVNLIRQASEGVSHAHDFGIIHRDLKPDNLFAAKLKSRDVIVKVLDFGIAKIRETTGMLSHNTRTGTVLGTPYYMSPEQARGLPDVDGRTDVYSLAAILYELLSGSKPHVGAHYNALIFDIIERDPKPLDGLQLSIPPGLSAIVAKGLARNRDGRFPTAAAFSQALEPYDSHWNKGSPRRDSVQPDIGTIPTLAVATPESTAVSSQGLESGAGHAPVETNSLVPSTHDPVQRSTAPAVAAFIVLVGVGGVVWAVWHPGLRKPQGHGFNLAASAALSSTAPALIVDAGPLEPVTPPLAKAESIATVPSTTATVQAPVIPHASLRPKPTPSLPSSRRSFQLPSNPYPD